MMVKNIQNFENEISLVFFFEDISLPKSATICYTAALLKARAVAST
jgi:hypothetical protein